MNVRFAPLFSLLLWAALETYEIRAQAPVATATLPVEESIAAPSLLRDDKGTVTVTSAPSTVILNAPASTLKKSCRGVKSNFLL